jgi:hypothetical protein
MLLAEGGACKDAGHSRRLNTNNIDHPEIPPGIHELRSSLSTEEEPLDVPSSSLYWEVQISECSGWY